MIRITSASCIHGSHAVDVAARRGRGISWCPSHGVRSTLQWGYSSLACDASHVTWSDRRPGYVARFRNLMHSLRAWRYRPTLQYCSQRQQQGVHWPWVVNALCSAELLTSRSKHFAPHNLRLWLRWPSGANYSYSANFWLHYSAEYE